MTGITVVAALAVEAQIACRADEKRLEQVSLGKLVDIGGDINVSATHRNRSPESQESIQMKSRNFCVVPLKIGEIEVIRKGFLRPGETHRLEKSLAPVYQVDNQFELSASFLLRNGLELGRGHAQQNVINQTVIFLRINGFF